MWNNKRKGAEKGANLIENIKITTIIPYSLCVREMLVILTR